MTRTFSRSQGIRACLDSSRSVLIRLHGGNLFHPPKYDWGKLQREAQEVVFGLFSSSPSLDQQTTSYLLCVDLSRFLQRVKPAARTEARVCSP